MKIEVIEVREVSLPLVDPVETSFGVVSRHHCLLVALRSGDLCGYGEIVAGLGPFYSGETIESARLILAQHLIPRVLGTSLGHPTDVMRRVSAVRGNHLAKAGLDGAAWDLWSRADGRSLAAALGGMRETVKTGVSIGIKSSLDELAQVVGRYVADGYQRLKLKIRPGWDLEPLRMVRRSHPDVAVMADANGAYSEEDLETFQAIDELGLLMIEQPLRYDDLAGHARLQRRLATPICLDESIESLSDVDAALELGSCRVINIKPGRVGGLSEAVRIHDYCRDRGVPVWCGGMFETGVGRALNVALASLPNFTLPGDISASSRYFERDVVVEPLTLAPGGTIRVPKSAGSGIDIDMPFLETVTLRVDRYPFAGA